MEIGGYTKKSDKTNKKSKRLQIQGEIADKMINNFRYFFDISPQNYDLGTLQQPRFF